MEKKLSREVWLLWRNRLFLLVFWALATTARAQNIPPNLVLNGGFEEKTGCPNGPSDLQLCDDWNNAVGSVDFYHLCDTAEGGVYTNAAGTQHPQDSAFIGIGCYTSLFAGGQEVVTTILLEPLIASKKYRVRFKVSYADSANFAICCLGAILSTTPPPQGPYTQNLSSVELILQESEFDTTTWFQYDGVYTAQGGEDKIYLGTFRPESDMNPVLVRPNGSPTYNSAYFYVDDVEVYEDDLVGLSEIENPSVDVTLYPNPSNGDVNVSIIGGTVETDYHLRVMDMMGREVFMEAVRAEENQLRLPLSAGTYLYDVSRSDNGEKVEQGSVVIMRRY